MPSALVIIFAILGVGYVLLNAGGGYVDSTTGIGPQSELDIVNRLAIAIAHAEGFYRPGSWPARNHNPGDISDTYLSNGFSAGKATFADDQTGWNALTYKLERIVGGMSTVYPVSDSIMQLAQTWTGGDNPTAWASNVAASLGVDPNSTLNDLVAA